MRASPNTCTPPLPHRFKCSLTGHLDRLESAALRVSGAPFPALAAAPTSSRMPLMAPLRGRFRADTEKVPGVRRVKREGWFRRAGGMPGERGREP